jgi:hypothetical protein
MAKTLNKGYDTTNETSLVTAAVGFDFSTDFRVKQDQPNETKLVNTTSPIDRPEQIRIAYSEVSDVYNNTSIDPSVYAASRKGVQILAQLSDVYSLTDSVDASYRVDLPVSAHIVIRIPACEHISSSDVLALVGRLNGCLYDNQVVNADRLQAMLRGALKPGSM